MGTCECEHNIINKRELKNYFTRSKSLIKEQANIIKKGRQKKEKLIKKFIIKNISRLYRKEKFNLFKNKAKSRFLEKEELDFQYDQSYFEKQINDKLEAFFRHKIIILRNELFSFNNLIHSMHSFDKLRDKISTYYNKDIYNNQKDYYNNLVSYLEENNLIKKKIMNPNLIKILYEKMNLNEGLNEDNEDDYYNSYKFHNKKSVKEKRTKKRGVNEIEIGEERKGDIIRDMKKRKTKAESNMDNIWDNKAYLLKYEIDNLFDICFDSTKKNLQECQKKSVFLDIMISQENHKKPNINFTSELKKLMKLLYYIYLLKKHNYLSNTNCFYKINPIYLKKESVMKNKNVILKHKNSKKENIFKIKLLKKSFSEKKKYDSILALESNIHNTMSSILSEEDEKEYYSLISTNNDFKLLKSKTIKNENIIKKEEKKVNDDKNDSDLYSDITEEKEKEKEKNSFHDLVKKAHNLKFINKIRLHPRTNTDKKKGSLAFCEYYNGQFDDTVYLYAGVGTLVSQNMKKLYHGTFRYGKMEGFGIIYLLKDDNNMEYYMGENRQNKIEGYGIRIKINNTEFNYMEGNFLSNVFISGKYVKIKKKNESVITINYVGEIKDYKFSGIGILTEKQYEIREEDNYTLIQKKEYKGPFINGKKSGKGKETFNNLEDPNKNYKYEGNFENGLKDGFGKMEFDKFYFVQKYEGFFKNDKPFHLYGIVNFKSGDIYEGFFVKNSKEHLGLYTFYESKSKQIIEQYFGGFLGDFKNGIGKTIVEDGEIKMFLGPYKEGEKEGQFEKIIYKNLLMEEKKKINLRSSCRSNYEIQKKQIKSYPVYQEDEIIDVNDNYYYNEFLDT